MKSLSKIVLAVSAAALLAGQGIAKDINSDSLITTKGHSYIVLDDCAYWNICEKDNRAMMPANYIISAKKDGFCKDNKGINRQEYLITYRRYP
jgi:hypothetical protein